MKEQLKKNLRLLSEQFPAGIVVNTKVKELLEQEKDFHRDPVQQFSGLCIYAFEDIPCDASALFYDRELLKEYLALRKKHGHQKALDKLPYNYK